MQLLWRDTTSRCLDIIGQVVSTLPLLCNSTYLLGHLVLEVSHLISSTVRSSLATFSCSTGSSTLCRREGLHLILTNVVDGSLPCVEVEFPREYWKDSSKQDPETLCVHHVRYTVQVTGSFLQHTSTSDRLLNLTGGTLHHSTTLLTWELAGLGGCLGRTYLHLREQTLTISRTLLHLLDTERGELEECLTTWCLLPLYQLRVSLMPHLLEGITNCVGFLTWDVLVLIGGCTLCCVA